MTTYRTTDAAGFTVYTCPMCGGSSHPATGSQLSAGWVVCWRCTLGWARWVQAWTASKGRRKGLSFYDYVGPPKQP